MSHTTEKTALIAMSGGVDSSVAALLVQAQGYRCEGVTMRLYQLPDPEGGSRSQTDIDDAALVAAQLGIVHTAADLTSEFRQNVIERFISAYELGATPNPCIYCNGAMKFGMLLRYADQRGLNYIVTGHYARVEYDEESGRYLLKKALDADKDQSYVLYMLSQRQLGRILFPLGSMHKDQVRAAAERSGFRNYKKRESQDICFVPDGDYVGFMERYRKTSYPEGDFLDETGRRIGRHRGAVRYTVGQRKGLGIALGEPAYVIAKNMKENTVTVGAESALYSGSLLADDVNWISIPALTGPIRVKAKIRYRQQEQPATVYPDSGGRVRVEFDAPQRAISIGQAVVFYAGDTVVGGGTICQVSP